MLQDNRIPTNTIFLPTRFFGQKSLRKGDSLPLIPSLLWKINTGFVRAFSWNNEGELITLGIWGPGDYLGQPLMQSAELYELECLTSVQLNGCSPEKEDLQHIILAHLYLTQELLSILHNKTVPQRLLLLLHWLACRFGEEMEQGWVLNLRLTHQALSEVIVTTRVTVTRILKTLEAEGNLKFLNNRSSVFLPRKKLQPYITPLSKPKHISCQSKAALNDSDCSKPLTIPNRAHK